MMLSRPRNIMMVCSSSDDGKTRELEGQLDIANLAQAQAQKLIASLSHVSEVEAWTTGKGCLE